VIKGSKAETSAADTVRSAVSRIRAMKDDARTLAGDISAEFNAAEAAGLHRKALRLAIRYAGMEPIDVSAEFSALYSYMVALGILAEGAPVFRQTDLLEIAEKIEVAA
jgi:uncharacterized protein (UPF0335 family)